MGAVRRPPAGREGRRADLPGNAQRSLGSVLGQRQAAWYLRSGVCAPATCTAPLFSNPFGGSVRGEVSRGVGVTQMPTSGLQSRPSEREWLSQGPSSTDRCDPGPGPPQTGTCPPSWPLQGTSAAPAGCRPCSWSPHTWPTCALCSPLLCPLGPMGSGSQELKQTSSWQAHPQLSLG